MSSLFGSSKPAPAPAKTVMPDEEDPSVLSARRKVYETAAARSGRASTILSDSYGSDKLGGRSS